MSLSSVSFEIQERLLSTLYPTKSPDSSFSLSFRTRHQNYSVPCCNCQRVDGFRSPTVHFIRPFDYRTGFYAMWLWFTDCPCRNEPYHYYSNPICGLCADAIQQFIQENIIASYSVTLKQFDSVCTIFPHELNRIIFEYRCAS